jgi:hypothetical protein
MGMSNLALGEEMKLQNAVDGVITVVENLWIHGKKVKYIYQTAP